MHICWHIHTNVRALTENLQFLHLKRIFTQILWIGKRFITSVISTGLLFMLWSVLIHFAAAHSLRIDITPHPSIISSSSLFCSLRWIAVLDSESNFRFTNMQIWQKSLKLWWMKLKTDFIHRFIFCNSSIFNAWILSTL